MLTLAVIRVCLAPPTLPTLVSGSLAIHHMHLFSDLFIHGPLMAYMMPSEAAT